MVIPNFAGFVHPWASYSSSFTSRSILEKIWSIIRLGNTWIQSCSSRGYTFDLFNSPNCCDVLIDLSMLIIVSFESCKLVLFWVRYMHLKFGCESLISSIRAYVVVFVWMLAWSLMYLAWQIVWYRFYGLLEHFVGSGISRRWSSSSSHELCVSRTAANLLRLRCHLATNFTCVFWFSYEIHAMQRA